MSKDSYHENRKFDRVLYNAQATLTGQSNYWYCTVIDLSLKGCLLQFDENWECPSGGSFHLSIAISNQSFIKMHLQAAHSLGSMAGFKCKSIDLNSASQLRRLVELNLGDSQLLLRNLSALIDYKEQEPLKLD